MTSLRERSTDLCNPPEGINGGSVINKEKGLIYNIQRYSLHDGPGIRTIVFLKGCPLRCLWCSNPESQSCMKESMNHKTVGEFMTVDEVVKICGRDQVFYNGSNGGVTLSGGEPLLQYRFTASLIDALKQAGINVALETSGYLEWALLKRVIEKADQILLDIKVMDNDLHRNYTGTDNRIILDNARKMSRMGKDLIIRVPVVPDMNNDWINLSATCKFAKTIGVQRVELLPYHRLGEHKYEQLGRSYPLKNLKTQKMEELADIASKLRDKFSINVEVIQ